MSCMQHGFLVSAASIVRVFSCDPRTLAIRVLRDDVIDNHVRSVRPDIPSTIEIRPDHVAVN